MCLSRISIIVPVYNVENYIIECLESVVRQKCQSQIECLIIDDCGTDNSIHLVEEWINNNHGNISFSVIHHEFNKGLSAARNTGMDAATGDYIFFLDSDDLIKEDCVANFEGFIQEHTDIDVAVCGIELIGGGESDLPKIKDTLPDIVDNTEVLRSFVRHEWFVLAQSKFYKSSFLRGNGIRFLEGIIHEDNLWSYEVANSASSLGVIRRPCYLYRIREGSIMTSTKLEKRINSLHSIISTIYVNSPRDKERLTLWADYLQMLVYLMMGMVLKNCSEDFCKKTYQRIRKNIKWGVCDSFKLYGFALKKLIRDLHFSLPPVLGYQLLRILSKKVDNANS